MWGSLDFDCKIWFLLPVWPFYSNLGALFIYVYAFKIIKYEPKIFKWEGGGGCANPGSAFGLGFFSTTSLLLALNLLQGYFLSSIGCVMDLKLKVSDSISFLIHHMNMYNQGPIYLLISIKGPGTINNLNFFAPTLFARNAIRPGSIHPPVLFVQGPFAFILCMNNIL